MMAFLETHWLDILTTVLGLLYIWLEYRASIALWFVGIVMPALDIYLYWSHGLYGDAVTAQQVGEGVTYLGVMEQNLEVLKEAGLTSVEYVFSTHPHQDHLGGMIPMLEAGLGVGTFFTVFPHDYVEFIGDYEVQPETIKALEAKGIPVADLKPDDIIPFGNAEITVLRIPDSSIGTSARTCNDMSAMLMVKYGDCSVLLTADVERMDEIELAELYDLKADILKYPHHGMSVIEPVFLDEIRPEFVFFTHGAGDTHNAQVQIYQAGYERMCFATWGTITMRTDGTKWIVKQEILPEYTEIAERYVYGK